MARLKLATYNINGIRARLGALLEWLAREQPDVVCLQELKAPDEAFPSGDIEAAGYGAIWHGQKSWNGVAILARGAQPRERRRGLRGDDADVQSRYLEASVHGLVVGCLYLPNGNPWPGPKFDYKLDWFERLSRHACSLLREGAPTVLAGDFNVVPTDELDIYDPKSWRKDALLQPESRDAYFRLLGQGWTDSLRSIAGDARVFTFWDYFRRHWERDAGLRIDHLLLSPQLAPMLVDAGVDRWVRGRPGASDHAPTWVLLDAGAANGPASDAGESLRADVRGKRTEAKKARDAAAAAADRVDARRPAAGSKPAGSKKAGVGRRTEKNTTEKAGSTSGIVKGIAAKKAVAKKGSTEKAVAKRIAAKKGVAGSLVAKKAVARKVVARKGVAKKAVAKSVTK